MNLLEINCRFKTRQGDMTGMREHAAAVTGRTEQNDVNS